jgi:hypothetical protein
MKKKTLSLGAGKLTLTGGTDGLEGLKKRTQERIDARREEPEDRLVSPTEGDWWPRFVDNVRRMKQLEENRNGCIQDGAYKAVNNWPDVDFEYYEKYCHIGITIGGFDISIRRGQNQPDGWVDPSDITDPDDYFEGVFRITVHRSDHFEMYLDDNVQGSFYERALLDRVFKAEEGEER